MAAQTRRPIRIIKAAIAGLLAIVFASIPLVTLLFIDGVELSGSQRLGVVLIALLLMLYATSEI